MDVNDAREGASFLFGYASGMLTSIVIFMKWIMSDPDGQGGWRSRLQQLGAEHKDKKGETK